MSKPRINRPDIFGDKEFISKLMQRVIPITETGCWLWTEAWGSGNYGTSRFRKYTPELAHRAMYRAMIGEIPDGKYVCHKCDTPPCCNPSHLFLGDQAQNMADRKSKGRYQGKMHGQAKLEADVIPIIRSSNKSLGVLSREYGVSRSAIFNIIHRITWRYVP